MTLPRTSTLEGAESAAPLPSKMRTFSNNVTAPLAERGSRGLGPNVAVRFQCRGADERRCARQDGAAADA